ncbi:MAG: hypothetical protein GQ532_18675 [Methylomarinum sp.]|nr:hypothetical protein [Methylomarinum sp.]
MKNITNTSTFSQNVKQLKASYSKDAGAPLGQAVSEAAHKKNELKKADLTPSAIKQQLNSAILKTNAEASVSAGNEPLALLYKTAIEGINDVLKADFGDNAIQAAYDSELDVSPEATADRIVSMSTAFFSQYQKQNPGMSNEEAAKSFAEIIGGGINQGFSEAREILTGLNVLEGDIASNIDTTYDLVQEGLKAFVDSYINVDAEESD